ncbi:hypothetical protein [Streptacidiphilus sp. PAMC 29251]
MATAIELPAITSGMKTEVKPVVLDVYGAAAYVNRTVKAMRRMRERRVGPASFISDGRVTYRVAELDRHLAKNEAADSRSNPDLDPTLKPPEPRRTRASRPRNGNGAGIAVPTPLASSTPTHTGTHQ